MKNHIFLWFVPVVLLMAALLGCGDGDDGHFVLGFSRQQPDIDPVKGRKPELYPDKIAIAKGVRQQFEIPASSG
ncbi:MAG: hypothetical protein LBD44_06780, partial [Spirochaetaceae bacterium]|nr:hypothetical protein [Spirochaetaceae bacterium]